jgi:glycine cleavage system H protein
MRDLPALDPDALYSRGHLWVRFEADGTARVGLDAFAARIVGRLSCVVLPLVGSRLQRGRPCTWLDQPGGTLTLLAPLSGLVLECNEKLARGTDFELHDSMASAWLFVLQPHRPRKESADLLGAEAFSAMVQSDIESWHQALVRAFDVETMSECETMADGGVLMPSAIDLLGARGMHRLAARYLQNCIR